MCAKILTFPTKKSVLKEQLEWLMEHENNIDNLAMTYDVKKTEKDNDEEPMSNSFFFYKDETVILGMCYLLLRTVEEMLFSRSTETD